MFKKIVSWSTLNRNKTIFLAVLFTLLGVYAGMNMKVDVLPDINKPTVIVFAEADGLAPEEIEKAVLIPLENAVLGTANVERVRGTASFALGIINIEFPFSSDIYKNRQLVQERISTVALPSNVKVSLGPVSSVMGEIMWAGVKSDSHISPIDLRTYVDFTLKPNLLKVKGISDVIVMGGDVLEWQVRLNADALGKYGIAQEEVNLVLERNLQNASAGILQQQNKEYSVRIFVAPKEISELAEIAIQTENGVVRLGEIASFVEGASIVRGGASVDGSQGIILRIFKQPDAETLKVSKAVDTLFADLQKTAPSAVTLRTDLFRQEWFISAGLSNVEKALFEALIIVGLVVFLVLTKWRPALITLIAIPTSIAVTAIIFKLLGLSVNVMTLGGIAVATSELVDDAIVSVENIIKRLRGKNATGLDRLKIIINAVQEVRGSIIYATILVILAFVPVFFLPGVEGRLLTSLGLSYIISLIASLIVSLTLTPALASWLINDEKNEEKSPKIITWIESNTERILKSIIHSWKIVTGLFIIMIVATVILYANAGKEGIPPFNEDSLTIGVLLPNGTGLETTNLFVQNIGAQIKSLPFVSNVSNTTGRAGADAHASGANSGEMQIVFKEGSTKKIDEYIPQVQNILNKFPGASYSLGKPITHRVEELLSGVRAPIVIKLYGDDVDKLRSYGNVVISALHSQTGVSNAQLSRDVKVPEIHIYPDLGMLSKQGNDPGLLGEEIESGFIGNNVGEVVSGLQRIPVVTKLDNESRNSFSGLRDTLVGETGVNIGNSSSIEFGEGRTSISHEGGKRVVVVSANYEGGDVVGAVDSAKLILEKREQPENITVSYEGTYQSQKENSSKLLFLAIILIVIIAFILYRLFSSWVLTGLILLNIPVALFGGLLSIYIDNGTISLAHLVGFISLAGVVSRNGIMLISRIKELDDEKIPGIDVNTVILATKERVVPILMTSVVAGLALIPFILGASSPGNEFLAPIAVVSIGGLITSTITSLFFMPVLLERFGRKI